MQVTGGLNPQAALTPGKNALNRFDKSFFGAGDGGSMLVLVQLCLWK